MINEPLLIPNVDEKHSSINNPLSVISAGNEQKNGVGKNKEDKHAATIILKEILIGTSSFGVRSLFVAAHYIGNGLIMSSLGPATAAASSVATTIQTFTIGASSGFLVGTGVELGVALGKRNIQAAGAVTKTGWLMSFVLGGVSSIAFLSTRYTLPLILEDPTANAAADFFETFAIAAIPDLLIWTNGQIVFKVEKNYYIPLLGTIIYRGSALGLSYYFATSLGYGARGVGLGAGVAGWGSLLLFQPWFSREAYKQLNLYSPRIENFCKHLVTFLSDGWKLSLQRITEWANLAIITQIIGAWSNQNLLAEQPSVLMLTLCNLLSQGFAQASMMIATEDCTKIKGYFEKFEETSDRLLLIEARKLIDKNYKNCYLSTIAGLGFNTILATSLYFGRHTIIHWYLPDTSSDATKSLAETLFWVNAISLIPDAIRIITGGVLRGWGDLLFPTVVSLVIMSAIGIPIGFGVGLELSESILPLFIARIIALVLSAAVNCYKIATHTQEDEIEYDNLFFTSELLLSFDSQEVAYRLTEQARLATLEQNALAFGLAIQDDENLKGDLFTVIASAVGHNQTKENIKKRVVNHIKSNPDLYQAFFADRDRQTFFKELTDGQIWVSSFLTLAIARACNISLVVINSDDTEPTIIFQQNAANIIYVGHQADGYYHLLTGEPNNEMRSKIDAASKAAAQHDSMRNRKPVFSGSLPSYFFARNQSNVRRQSDLKQEHKISISEYRG